MQHVQTHLRAWALGLVLVAGWLGSAQAATQVGVSVGVEQPGFYGRIEIGNTTKSEPPPAVIYPQPVVITPVRVGTPAPAPIYLRVRPGHEKNWRKHCHRYDACGRPVYFVTEDWYEHHHGHGKGKGHKKH